MSPKKRHILLEAAIASIMVLFFTYTISFLPLKFEFLKVVRQDVYGFDIYDLYYADKTLNTTSRDTNIVLIQIADNREAIADQINMIEGYDPKVLGIDAIFEGIKDSLGDLKLAEAIKSHQNIVCAEHVDLKEDEHRHQFNFFQTSATDKYGFINLTGNEYSVVRTFQPYIDLNGNKILSFAASVAHQFDPGQFDKLMQRNNHEELINYTGNMEKYTCITREELHEFDTTHQLSLLKNKIVLLGFFVKYPPLVLEDLHFTPLNHHFAGKSFPDMYGAVIHANILSMIIRGKYGTIASPVLSYLFAFLFTFLLLSYVIYRFSKRVHPGHGKFLLIQFLYILLILFIFLQLYNLFLLKVYLLPILISLVLSIELLGLYRGLATWLHRKYQFKTVFMHKHII